MLLSSPTTNLVRSNTNHDTRTMLPAAFLAEVHLLLLVLRRFQSSIGCTCYYPIDIRRHTECGITRIAATCLLITHLERS